MRLWKKRIKKNIIKEKDNGLAPDGASEKYAHTRLTSTAWKMAALGGGNLEDAIEESRLYTINGRNYYYLQSYTKYGEYKADSRIFQGHNQHVNKREHTDRYHHQQNQICDLFFYKFHSDSS